MENVFATEDSTTAAPSTRFADLQSAVYTPEDTIGAGFTGLTFKQIMSDETKKTNAVTKDSVLLNKAQAPLSLAALEDAIADIDMSNYATTGEDYTVDGEKVSAAEKVQSLIDAAQKAIEDAADLDSDADKVRAYKNALNTLDTELEAVKTIEDSEIDDSEEAKDVAGAVNDYLQFGISTVYKNYKLEDTNNDDYYEVDAALEVAPFMMKTKKPYSVLK